MGQGVACRNYRVALFVLQKRKCLFCGKFCKFDSKGYTQFTLEHIVPKRFGGKNYRNVVGSCFKCNLKRARRIELLPATQHPAVLENLRQESQQIHERLNLWNLTYLATRITPQQLSR